MINQDLQQLNVKFEMNRQLGMVWHPGQNPISCGARADCNDELSFTGIKKPSTRMVFYFARAN